MKSPLFLDQLAFVAKVVILSTLVAIVLKTIAPRLAIPATPVLSLVIVLTPPLVVGGMLCWQLWTSSHGNATHPGRD